MTGSDMVKVWDLLVRVFHWCLVAAFFVTYVTEDNLMSLHLAAGYMILGLVAFRIVWGFIGTRHARFGDFVKSPSTVFDYLGDMLHFRAKRYLGHNPAGGAMVIALLLSLIAAGVTGLLAYGTEDHAGPLAAYVQDWPHWTEDFMGEAHEFLANLTLLLVVFHVTGVIVASLEHRENLISSMWHGRKRRDL
jgi:cytochrome b